MAPFDDADYLDEQPNAQYNSFSNLLNCFDTDADIDLDALPYQSYTGLHDRLERASGVDKRRGANPCTLTPAQRETWSKQLRAAALNADKQVPPILLAKELSQKLHDAQQEFDAIRLEASAKDPEFKQSLEYFQGKKPKEIRQAGVKMMIESLHQSPELVNDLLQEFAPEQAIAQSKIDDVLAFAKDKIDLADQQSKAADAMQKQIQNNTIVLKEAKLNMQRLAKELQTLQLQKDDVEHSWKAEVEEERQAHTRAKQDLKRARSELRDTQTRTNTLQEQYNASNSKLQSMKKDLQEANAECETKENARFDEAIRYQLSNQKAINLEQDLEAALRSNQTLEQQLKLKESESTSDASTIDRLTAEVERQRNLINRRADELVQVEDDHKKLQDTIKDLKNERDDLMQSLTALRSEMDNLKTRSVTTEGELENCKTRLTAAEGEGENFKTRLTTAEGERENYKTRLTATEAERDNFKTKYTTAKAEFAGLQSDVEEIVGEKDEVKQQLEILKDWYKQVIVFADMWKSTICQTGIYTREMFLSMGTSLRGVDAFRSNMSPDDIREQPLPISRIHGIDEAVSPANRILSVFGRIHTDSCKIPLATMGEFSRALGSLHVRPRRYSLLLLCGILHKRCALARESAEPCTLAASLVILKSIELLQCHLSGTVLLDLVTGVLDGIKEKLMLDSLLVRAILETLTSDRSLVQCLVSAQEFITVPDSNCKVSIDHDMLIAIRDDREVAYIRPCFYRLHTSFTDGFNLVFDGAPMFGSWKTPVWDLQTHMRTLLRVFSSDGGLTSESPEAGSLEHELIDVVM